MLIPNFIFSNKVIIKVMFHFNILSCGGGVIIQLVLQILLRNAFLTGVKYEVQQYCLQTEK